MKLVLLWASREMAGVRKAVSSSMVMSRRLSQSFSLRIGGVSKVISKVR